MYRRYGVFISYNSADQDAVHRVAERLRREKLEPWLDKWVLTPGRSWQEEIVEGLANSATCAVMVGPAGLGDWAREELAVAHDRAAKDRDFRLFLVLLPGAPEIDDPRLAFLRTRTWVDLRNGIADADAFQDLVAAITGSARAPTEDGDVDPSVSPYRGLAAFEEDNAEFFFGREDDTARVLELLKRSRFAAVIGASGSGKSSLVRAGVVPALRAGRLPGSESWAVRTFTPGARPLSALAAQMGRVLPAESMQTTLAALQSDERSLDLAATAGLADSPVDRRIVLVADQFEELFTLCTDEAERKAFLANLLYAATIPGGRVAVVIGMRADFYHRCAAYPQLRSLIASEQHLVGPLTHQGLRRAIEEPARRAGVDLEAGLLDTILADVGAHRGGLPLLQHVLFELWERRRGRMLTLEAYVAAGRLEGSLAKRANTVYEGLPPEQQAIARRALLRLVQPGEGTEDTRRRAALDELVSHTQERAKVEHVLEALAQERLVTFGHDEASGQRVVDITHEALIRGWPELRSWIAERRDDLRAERRLGEAAADWDQGGRDESLLYPTARLSAWEDRNLEGLNDLEREFLLASRTRQAREQAAGRRRVRIAVSGVVAATTVVAVVALLGLDQVAQERDLARSRLAVANARAQLEVDPQRALLLALEAYDLRQTPDSEAVVREAAVGSALLAQLSMRTPSPPTFNADGSALAIGAADGSVQIWEWGAGPTPRVFAAHQGQATSAQFSPDGRLLASAGFDATVRLTDAATGQPVRVLRGHEGPINSVRFSPDGRLLASGGTVDGTVRIWDAGTGSPVHTMRGHQGGVSGVGFSPDGTLVTSSGANDGTVRVWNLTTGSEARVLRGHAGAVGAVAFGPDGKRIVSGGAADGTVRVWDWASGEATVLRNDDGPVLTVAFSPDGAHVAGGGTGSSVSVWDWRGHGLPRRLSGHAGLVNGVSFSPDGKMVASASVDQVVRVWEWGRGPSVQALPQGGGAILGADWSRNGKLVAGGGTDGMVRVSDWATGAQVVAVGRHDGAVTALTFADDGTVVSGGFDGTIRIWDLATASQARLLLGHRGPVAAVAATADGRLIASTSFDGTMRVWDRETGAQLQEVVVPAGAGGVAFSPDGAVVATAGVDGAVRLFDWRHATERKVVLGHRGVANGATFSADGRLLVTAGFDSTVRVHEWDGRGELMVLRGHQGAVGDAGFSPDGNLIVSSGADGGIRIWDLATGRSLLTLQGHRRAVVFASFSPVDRLVLSAGLDGLLRVWRCDLCGTTSDVLSVARSRAVRSLTNEERDNFLPAPSDAGVDIVLPVVLLSAFVLGGGWLLYRLTGRRRGTRRTHRRAVPQGT